jgi:DNA-binding transcriptional MerR regulator
MANLRTGHTRGYRGQKGGAHQIPWREDRDILARIAQVRRLRSHGLTVPEIALRLEVSPDTVKDDFNRDKELAAENATDAREEHIGNLRELWRMTHDLLKDTDAKSLNKSALVGQLRQIEMDIAKLDGSQIDRSEVEATLHNGDLDVTVLAAYNKALEANSRGTGDSLEGGAVRPRLVGPGESEVVTPGDEARAASA